jgi:hypothetical protein
MRAAMALIGWLALMSAASASDVRHSGFADVLLGAWGPSKDLCAQKDKSVIEIKATTYTQGDRICSVGWVVETASTTGPSYSVHAICKGETSQDEPKPVDLIVRPHPNETISIGFSFDDLKTFQRCDGR